MAGSLLSPGVSSSIDRKSTRLNSSHLGISYAVFCLKKKKKRYVTNEREVKMWRSCSQLTDNGGRCLHPNAFAYIQKLTAANVHTLMDIINVLNADL